MDVSHLLDSLNEQQRQAVAAPRGSSLILAGAGSGKTRVLIHRIAWLIQREGLSPYSILAVTFTNKAAAEMRGRLEKLLDIPARGMWVGTFHGIAHRLLRAHHRDAGLPQNFQILDADDQLRLVKRVMISLDVDDKKWPARQALWWINGQKDEGLRPSSIEDYGDVYLKTHLAIYRAYEEACRRGGMVDFAELLLRAHELWLKNPVVLKHYQDRFSALLVDEFQDTNTIQYAWLRVLAGNKDNLMVVGDDDQSIYGWRGAKIENIQQFTKDFSNASTVRLEQNYRSTSNILTAANGLIDQNTGRLGKELWTDMGDGDPIQLYAGYNEIDEARYIVERIKSWSDSGNLYSESAILYRSNAQSRVLEEALLRAQMPYRIYGGQRFFERVEIRNVLAYMRLVGNRDADAAFERVVNTPPRGIGGKSVAEIRLLARAAGIPLWQAATKILDEGLLTGRARKAIAVFLGMIETLDEQTAEADLGELVEVVVEASGLKDYHAKEGGERGQARVENMAELVTAAKTYDPSEDYLFDADPDEQEAPTLSVLDDFLSHAALEAGEGQGDPDQDCVQLMTMHSAKGLEFPLVFLAGLEDGLFPHMMSLEEPGRLEEERRLCYVGVTRAMRQLYLTYAESRRINGSETFNRPSRFISEMPEEVIKAVRPQKSVVYPRSSPSPRSSSSRVANEVVGTNLKIGQRVVHQKFGEGVILNYEGEGSSARVQVNFSEGSKWLVMGYANLEALG
ncbi:MAG: DNA helicase II [Pseudomonadales bacterium]|jgi:DNA helicase-2/ATP-dependent DNA helicase PcrA|tara:strand:+ start:3056 stop:5266 length:2211 start_codon:yes stop_codon:yes gene_type:complete